MTKITTSGELNSSLQELEARRVYEWALLKDQLLKTVEHLKPVNLLKNAFKEVSSIPDLKTNLIKAAIGFTTRLLTKNISISAIQHPLLKIVGDIVEMVAASRADKRNRELNHKEVSLEENPSIPTTDYISYGKFH